MSNKTKLASALLIASTAIFSNSSSAQEKKHEFETTTSIKGIIVPGVDLQKYNCANVTVAKRIDKKLISISAYTKCYRNG